MPRPVRDDLEPEITLPDAGEQHRRATDAIDQTRWRAIVYDRTSLIGREPRRVVFGRLETRLRECREMEVGLDEGFMHMMMQHCDLAETRPVRDAAGTHGRRNGLLVYRLIRVGCRVRVTQAELARRYGRCRGFANEQIGKLRDWYFIVKQGRGWYEFAATLCWRGDLATCAAYREVQRVRDGLVITDGTTTLVTEDMDDDEVEAAE